MLLHAASREEIRRMEDGMLEKKFDQFSKAVWANTVLDSKTTIVAHLATAMTAGCYP
jgi:hypothetical protein